MREQLEAARRIATAAPHLRLLVLHGSRARATAHARSDWDFAYLADAGFDPDALMAALVEALHTDQLDLADLDRASGLLRYRVAADGLAVFERSPGLFTQFRLDAVDAWCDMEPVLRVAYDERLEQLAR